MSTPPRRPSAFADSNRLLMLISVISSAGDHEECARLLASGVSSLLPCRLCWVALRQPTAAEWHVVDQTGRTPPLVEVDGIGADLNPLHEAVVRHGASLLISAGRDPVGSAVPPRLAAQGITSLAVIPIQTLRDQLGLLIAVREDDGSFSADEVHVFETLAQHLAVAVENFRLAESLEESNRDLQRRVDERTKQLRHSEQRHRVLLEINNAIIANLNRESLFAAVAESMRDVSSFDRASLVLHDPERDVLTVYGLAGTSADRIVGMGSEFPRQGSHLEAIFENHGPHVREDLGSGGRMEIEEQLFVSGLRSYASVPLISKTRVLGALNFASRSVGRYSEDDVEFLLEVGQQVTLAVENMLAYERIDELQRQLTLENEYLREEDSSARGFGEIVGRSPAIHQVLEQVKLVAPTDASVLILGESGTGKELIARAIHERSHRCDGPLIRVNCAAIPHDLFESEFFGHVRGAFTGALRERVGRFELADGGTLFLDEVAEIPLDLQGKLLRVLQEATFERVGEEQTRQASVRVLAATNRDLRLETEAGRFRQDLYFRLSVFPLELPPLRKRRDDISPLARHFVKIACRRLGRRGVILPDEGLGALCDYDWPGNVRELQNIIERAVITSRDGVLRFATLASSNELHRSRSTDSVMEPEVSVLTYEDLRGLEKENIERALMQADGKIAGPGGAAERLGVKPTTLNSKLKAFGIRRRRS